MAYRTIYFRRDDNSKINRYFIFDTQAELLDSTLIVGDLAYAVDTKIFFIADSETTFTALSSAITLDNVKKYFGTDSDSSIYYDGTNLVINPREVGSGNLVYPKTSGFGIKVDVDSATFPWHDLLGAISIRGSGAADPAYNVYRGGIRGYQFSATGTPDEVFVEYHIPHDYLPGSDIYLHFHWSTNGKNAAGVNAGTINGGSVTWGAEVTYAKGHNQAAFPAPITFTVQQNASTTVYQHMIAEGQLSAASPSASQIDSDNIEVDGLILIRAYISANNITVASGQVPDPFLHFVDIHYQSTGIGTKAKAPNFYV